MTIYPKHPNQTSGQYMQECALVQSDLIPWEDISYCHDLFIKGRFQDTYETSINNILLKIGWHKRPNPDRCQPSSSFWEFITPHGRPLPDHMFYQTSTLFIMANKLLYDSNKIECMYLFLHWNEWQGVYTKQREEYHLPFEFIKKSS